MQNQFQIMKLLLIFSIILLGPFSYGRLNQDHAVGPNTNSPTRLDKIQVAGLPGAQSSASPPAPEYPGSITCYNDMNYSVPDKNGPSMWKAVQEVMSEGIIPPNGNYNIRFKHWPKIVREGTKLNVEYGRPGDKVSMCSSAAATAFMKYLTDLVNANLLYLSDDQINYINDRSDKAPFINGLNGNSYSIALLNQALGGTNISNPKYGDRDQLLQVLKQAKPGDIMQVDRRNKSGHATIFKEVKGNEFCYWASNKKTHGVSERCESINVLSYLTVSRPARQPCKMTGKLQNMMKDKVLAARLDSSDKEIAPNWIIWDRRLEVGEPGFAPGARPVDFAEVSEGVR